MAEVEIFTPAGVLAGSTDRIPLASDDPDLDAPLAVQDARWFPLDGAPATQRGSVTVLPDDILVIVADEPELMMHMTWYAVALDVGPYRLFGRLPVHPGYDPERSIARPGGSFVALSEVTIEVAGSDRAATATRPHVLVNRFSVDSVTSTLMLGHFFPGARLIAQEAAAPVA
ncbi:MAG TPA: hypothetical protein VE011_00105 [Candidatus Dormibacteraeota bacterium]|nr:hypothetical protein [Candidatus Dormibacteraeota bacterium]